MQESYHKFCITNKFNCTAAFKKVFRVSSKKGVVNQVK